MGRAKVNMELIKKEKPRNITFKKRKEGLLRKIHEFTTLCDVNACIIIYGPNQENNFVEPEVWSENHDQVWRLINLYKSKKDTGSCRTYGLADFFDDRKKRMEDELQKLRKRNTGAKLTTWFDFMDYESENQLRVLASTLSKKLEVVKNRIKSIRGNHPNQYLIEGPQQGMIQCKPPPPYITPGWIPRDLELELMNQQAISSVNPIEMHVPIHYPSTIDHQHPMHSSIDQNSMIMLLMNVNVDHQVQLGGGSSCNIQCASFEHQVYYESSTSGVLDNILYNNPKPLAHYNTPSSLQPMPPYLQMEWPTIPNILPQLHSSRDNVGGNDFVQQRMKN